MCMRERRIYIKDRDNVWFKKQEYMIWTWFILRKQDFTNFTMINNKMQPFSTDSWFEPSTSTPRDKTLPKCTSFFAWLFDFLLCLLDYPVFPFLDWLIPWLLASLYMFSHAYDDMRVHGMHVMHVMHDRHLAYMHYMWCMLEH